MIKFQKPDATRSIGLLIVPLLFVIGCAGSRTVRAPAVPSAFPNHQLEDVLALVNANVGTIGSFAAEARVAFRDPKRSDRFAADIRSRDGDSLFFAAKPAFGIEAGRALITRDSFFVYNRIEKVFYYGDLENGVGFVPPGLNGESAHADLLGELRLDPEEPWAMESGSTTYRLVDGSRGITCHIDPRYWKIVLFELRSKDGMLLERRSYSDFDLFGDTYVARRLVLDRPGDQTALQVYYTSIDTSPGWMSFDLNVPDHVKRVLIG